MRKEESMNTWSRPGFEQIKMDAEIGSYQDDSEPIDGSMSVMAPERVRMGRREEFRTVLDSPQHGGAL
jgi:hypothetical protein